MIITHQIMRYRTAFTCLHTHCHITIKTLPYFSSNQEYLLRCTSLSMTFAVLTNFRKMGGLMKLNRNFDQSENMYTRLVKPIMACIIDKKGFPLAQKSRILASFPIIEASPKTEHDKYKPKLTRSGTTGNSLSTRPY